MSCTSSTYPFTVTINRYPVSSDGTTRTGPAVAILIVNTTPGQLFDMIVDNPGPGNWAYTMNVTYSPSAIGDDTVSISIRRLVVLVTKR